MDPIFKVVVTRPSGLHKKIEILHIQQKDAYFNLVTESRTIFFSPQFSGRMRCGSKFIESESATPVAVYLGKGFPLVVDAPKNVPWWIVHLHDEPGATAISAAENSGPEALASVESLAFYRIHTGQDFLMATMVEQMMNGGMPEHLLKSFLTDLPHQLEPCEDLPATGNRRLAERLRSIILESEDKQINLKQIARELECHPSQLSREFRKLFGIAPYKFSFLLRLAKTREWLRRGQNLADVALNFEFSDQSHFTRAFRQVYRMTPNYYRNLYRSWWEISGSSTPTPAPAAS